MKTENENSQNSLLTIRSFLFFLVILLGIGSFSIWVQSKKESNVPEKEKKWVSLLKLSEETPPYSEKTDRSFLNESLPAPSLISLGKKIDLNRANSKDFETLPGIGPKLAQEIIKNRNEKGNFQSTTDLMRVKGIKEKKFEKIKRFITVRVSL